MWPPSYGSASKEPDRVSRIDAFLAALEEERFEIDLARRRQPALGRLYARNADLFSLARIAEVQRDLAGLTGVDERRARALLEFLARGRAQYHAAAALDQRLRWEIFGSIEVGDDRIPIRQVPAALAIAEDPDRRHAIEESHLAARDEQRHFAEAYLSRHREGLAEVGYGTHVEALQILGEIDLHAIAREGERFLDETDGVYRELLAWHLPRLAAVSVRDATAADAWRLEAAIDYDRFLTGGDRTRGIFDLVAGTGLDPYAEGRIEVTWGAYLGVAAGAVCRAPGVPEPVRLAVSTRSGRLAIGSFLTAFGTALHTAYTDPALPAEQRRLGDESVPAAVGCLFRSLLLSRSFLGRAFGMPKTEIAAYLRLEALATLLSVRREIGLLRWGLALHGDRAEPGVYAELLTEATAVRHDPRAALWEVDGEFAAARGIRAAQLGATLGQQLRSRFDEDWFRNPAAGPHLRNLFATGRQFSAPELSVQLSSTPLGFGPVLEELTEVVQ
jgi:hypothetical protein